MDVPTVTLKILKFSRLVGYISIYIYFHINHIILIKLFYYRFIKADNTSKKFATIINPNCSKSEEKKVSTVELKVLINNVSKNSTIPKITIEIGPKNVKYIEYVKNGFKIEKGEKEEIEEVLEARIIKLNPENVIDTTWFSIDSEEYEVKPIKITLLPKLIKVFCIDHNA